MNSKESNYLFDLDELFLSGIGNSRDHPKSENPGSKAGTALDHQMNVLDTKRNSPQPCLRNPESKSEFLLEAEMQDFNLLEDTDPASGPSSLGKKFYRGRFHVSEEDLLSPSDGEQSPQEKNKGNQSSFLSKSFKVELVSAVGIEIEQLLESSENEVEDAEFSRGSQSSPVPKRRHSRSKYKRLRKQTSVKRCTSVPARASNDAFQSSNLAESLRSSIITSGSAFNNWKAQNSNLPADIVVDPLMILESLRVKVLDTKDENARLKKENEMLLKLNSHLKELSRKSPNLTKS